MGLTLRNVKGSRLTFTELDNNFIYLQGLDIASASFNSGPDILTLTTYSGDTITTTIPTTYFTGNTPATCVSDLYVSNIHSCSPLHINPADEGNVYFGSSSGVTINVADERIGIGTAGSTNYKLWAKEVGTHCQGKIESDGGYARWIIDSHTNNDSILQFNEANDKRWAIGTDGGTDNFLITSEDIVGGPAAYSADTALYIKRSNNFVGINTISPVAPLTVDGGGVSSGPYVRIEGGGAVYPQTMLQLHDDGYAHQNESIIEFTFSVSGTSGAEISAINQGLYAVDGAKLYLQTYHTGGVRNDNQLVLSNDGNVGIGTQSPLEKLHLSASSSMQIRMDTTSGNASIILNGAENTFIEYKEDASRMWIVGNHNPNDYFKWATGNTFNDDTVMRLSRGGDLLIEGNLDVNGSSADFAGRILSGGTDLVDIFCQAPCGGGGGSFTGNTSGTCISDIWVSNIHSCSPLNINPGDEGNVFFGSTSGLTYDASFGFVGIGTTLPSSQLHIKNGSQLIEEGNLTMLTTDHGGDPAPVIYLRRDSDTPADGDKLGEIHFQGKNSSGSTKSYSKIYSQIDDKTPGTEDGQIVFAVIKDGTNRILGKWDANRDGLWLDDDRKISWGNGGDLTLSHDGSNSYIINDTGTLGLKSAGSVNISGDTTILSALTTTTFTMLSGATAGYVLTSDVSGNARWAVAGGGGTLQNVLDAGSSATVGAAIEMTSSGGTIALDAQADITLMTGGNVEITSNGSYVSLWSPGGSVSLIADTDISFNIGSVGAPLAGDLLASKDGLGNLEWVTPSIDPYNDIGNVSTFNWDVSDSTNYEVTLTGDTEFTMTNMQNGDYGTLIVHQDATGSRTLTFNFGSNYVVNGGGGQATLTTDAGATDILSFTYNGTAFYWTVGNDYT